MMQQKVTPRIEEYLESIVNMISEGEKVLAVRLAERLQLTPPTVSASLQRMKRDGLITIGTNKEIALTDKGKIMAVSVVRRHRLAERLLTDVLGLEWHEVHQEACLLEHAISTRVEERLNQTLNRPATCPHGNPIPNGDSIPPQKGMPLDSVPEGTKVVVERLTEEATRNPKLLEHLFSIGVVPGASFMVKKASDYTDTLALSDGDKEITLAASVSNMIWVTIASAKS